MVAVAAEVEDRILLVPALQKLGRARIETMVDIQHKPEVWTLEGSEELLRQCEQDELCKWEETCMVEVAH